MPKKRRRWSFLCGVFLLLLLPLSLSAQELKVRFWVREGGKMVSKESLKEVEKLLGSSWTQALLRIELLSGKTHLWLTPYTPLEMEGLSVYFTGSDFTRGKEWALTCHRIKKVEVITDRPEEKGLKVHYTLWDAEKELPYYELLLTVEIGRVIPGIFLIEGSLKNKGQKEFLASVGWGPFPGKSFTVPRIGLGRLFGRTKTKPLQGQGKIGIPGWTFIQKNGEGIGLMGSMLLGYTQEGVFINAFPSKKKLPPGEEMKVIFALMKAKSSEEVRKSFEKLKKLGK